MQNEIRAQQPLLDEHGNVANPGWCRRNLYRYNIEKSPIHKMRLKEWDFYQISDGEVMVQINLFNISLATCATFGFLDLKTGRKFDAMGVALYTPNKNRLNANGDFPNSIDFRCGKTMLAFDTDDCRHRIRFSGVKDGKPITAEFFCERLPHHESITIATPFSQSGHFFYTNKINCLATRGKVTYGDEEFSFSPENTYTVLDWGRGIWPYGNCWYWANGSTKIDGKLFGFELTWGFGDESAATETALFYDGVCHKIGAVGLEQDPEKNDGWMRPWHFKDREGRLDLTMTPFYDNYSNMMPLNLYGIKTHQVFGLWNGTVTLDDGKVLEIQDMFAFCEKSYNKW